MEIDKKAEIARLKKEISKAKAGVKKNKAAKEEYQKYERASNIPEDVLNSIPDMTERMKMQDMASDYRVGKINNTKIGKGAKAHDINEGRLKGYEELLKEQMARK